MSAHLRNESKSPQQCAGVSVSAQPARSTLRDAPTAAALEPSR